MRIFAVFLLLFLSACKDEAVKPSASVSRHAPGTSDFSGYWEMDYGRSDNVDSKLQTMYREWYRNMSRQARGDQRRANMGVQVDSSRFRSIVDVARLADQITSSQVLEIEQSEIDIEIQRENNFSLSCVFREGEPEVVVAELGSEVCGWDAHQLVFYIRLPDGLDIQHRLTLSEDADRLHVATQVDSRKSAPFTLNRFYFRYDPMPENYSCEYTLSRGNVCQSEVN
jgi:hypothetical protein